MILAILDELSSTTKKNEKIEILKKYKSNQLLKRIFELGLNPLVKFGQKKIPNYSYDPKSAKIALSYALDLLLPLINRDVTGNKSITYLQELLASLDLRDANVIKRVISKKMKCGVSEGTVNKVWPKLIKKFPVSKATPYSKKNMQEIVFPALSQTKIDGARCEIKLETGKKAVVYSSSGREMSVFGIFDYLQDIFNNNVVVDGELVVVDQFGEIIDRKTGNGIINKAVKGTLSYSEAQKIRFIVFDVIDLIDWKNRYGTRLYKDNFEYLESIQNLFESNVQLVDCKEVNSIKEAIAHFRELYKSGEEGSILKNKKMLWEPKRTKNMIKFKGVLTTDLIVVDFIPGKNKYTGMIGSLVCQSVDGKVLTNVGTGLSDEDRQKPYSYYAGEIVEIAYNELITSKGTKKESASLFLPRFIELRTDKFEADTIDLIVNKELNF